MKLVLNGHEIAILYSDELASSEGHGLLGRFSFIEQPKIQLLKDLNPFLAEETLVHEVCHAIFRIYGQVKAFEDEGAIDALANALAQLGVGEFLMKKANE